MTLPAALPDSLDRIPSVEEILAAVTPPLTPEHAGYVRKAYDFAREAHEGQLRHSGAPYFQHCAEVGLLLAQLLNDWATIAAGMLHDTVEDCGVSLERIHALVPDPVAELVDGVTKISAIHFTSAREKQAGNLRKMILAMSRDVRVMLIKLCDRLHNMRTLGYVNPEKAKNIATATMEIFAPLAKRLGMENIASELEDLSFRHLNPVAYRSLANHIERNAGLYSGIIESTRGVLEEKLAAAEIKGTVQGRIKHISSIWRKMSRQGLAIDEVHDMVALRIITETVGETYEALGIVHQLWPPLPGKFKDYIATPKPNGYQSLHTSVIGQNGIKMEVQIRSQAMHRSADQGIAAHWQYKEKGGSTEVVRPEEGERLAWMRQLVDWLVDIRDPQEFMTELKKDVSEASIFCLTPKGDLIELQLGSTVLDFAYHIHTKVGERCSGGRVNQKMAPLRTVLKTGDVVEVVTSKTAHPTPDWLQIAHSGRTRNKIRHWIKVNDRRFFLDIGRSMFAEALHVRAPEMRVNEGINKLEPFAEHFGQPTAEDVLIEIGSGQIKPNAVVLKMIPQEIPPAVRRVPSITLPRPSDIATAGDKIIVEGNDRAITRLAHCCNPKPGDPIVGFVTQGRGISIHHVDCKGFRRIVDSQSDAIKRVIGVQWGGGGERATMQAVVRVLCQDRQGLLSDISQAVSLLGLNIIRAQTNSNLKTNTATFKLTVQVPDESALTTLINRLASLPSVRSIRRVAQKG